MFKTNNLKEFKALVKKLSQYESRITIEEAKLLEKEAVKYGGKLRYDMNPIKGKVKIPHIQIEGLGQRIEGRKIWIDIQK